MRGHATRGRDEPAVPPTDPGLRDLLGTVGEAMAASVLSVDVAADCHEVALELHRSCVSGAPVTRDGRVVGVVTLSDLAVRSGANPAISSGPFLRFGRRLQGVKVAEVMSHPPRLVQSEWPLIEAVELMERAGVNRVPVVDGVGRPVGILARDDVIGALARRSRLPAADDRPRIAPD